MIKPASLLKIFLFIFVCYSFGLSAQSSKTDSLLALLATELPDKDRASVLQTLGPRYINTMPDSALLLAEKAFDITESLGDYEMHSRSFRRIGHALYVVGDWDRFRTTLLSYAKYAEENQDYFQVAASYRNLSKIGEATKQPDSSLYYLDKCLEVLAIHPDSIVLIDVYLSKGLTYKYKGYYEMSIDALLEGVRVAEAIESSRKLGYLDMNLGITYNTMGRDEKSAFHMKRSIEYFEKDGNLRGVTRSTSNLGFAYMALERYDDAKETFAKAITLAEETSMPNIVMHSHMGLADIAYEEGDYDISLENVTKAETIAKDIDAPFTIGAALRFRGKLALKMNKPMLARSYLSQAEQFQVANREPIEEDEYFFEMAELYEGVGRYKDALSYTQKGNALRDSVFTLKKEQQFAELNLIYETEKKDAEIKLLNKQTELDSNKKRSLWIGMGLLMLLGTSIILSLYQKKKKAALIAAKEKEIEIEKRKSIEQELEFKKKELTTKALQLASKNEFLNSLEGEINNLKSSVDSTVSKTSQRISRLIHNDQLDDEEWQQFGKEFTSIHEDFLRRLKAQYGEFTKNEMRLIALLKMSLSSKDIANTLRISNDGVKKARYRLRKKMQLESDVDIQNYLIHF